MIQELTGSLLYLFTDEDQPRIRPAHLFIGDGYEVIER